MQIHWRQHGTGAHISICVFPHVAWLEILSLDLTLVTEYQLVVLIKLSIFYRYVHGLSSLLYVYRYSRHEHFSWLCIADTKVLCLGLIQSLFEGAMYTFVLEWTPALTPAELPAAANKDTAYDADGDGHAGSIPHGYIFGSFMVRRHVHQSIV